MAQSGKRKKKHSGDENEIKHWTDGIPMSPSWWAPAFCTVLVLGLIWLVITYMTGARYPIPAIGSWNTACGVGLLLVGFLMTLRWR
ncbi:cell division protein CrgA [Gleimia hominis]|uniref:Cell division protein CrgA n=1 Tax=Gleimia hominis TaxID=595468 RepID=A0ABU3I8U2_9ACTO|nr:cell division protein CrgA [Gleimia hominis]MDT3766799.1 cell division protein CrgA [Gleimia hominis]